MVARRERAPTRDPIRKLMVADLTGLPIELVDTRGYVHRGTSALDALRKRHTTAAFDNNLRAALEYFRLNEEELMMLIVRWLIEMSWSLRKLPSVRATLVAAVESGNTALVAIVLSSIIRTLGR